MYAQYTNALLSAQLRGARITCYSAASFFSLFCFVLFHFVIFFLSSVGANLATEPGRSQHYSDDTFSRTFHKTTMAKCDCLRDVVLVSGGSDVRSPHQQGGDVAADYPFLQLLAPIY